MSDTATGLDLTGLAEKLRDIAEMWLYDGAGDRPLGDGSAYAYLYDVAAAVPSLLAAAGAVQRVGAAISEPYPPSPFADNIINRVRAALGTGQEGQR